MFSVINPELIVLDELMTGSFSVDANQPPPLPVMDVMPFAPGPAPVLTHQAAPVNMVCVRAEGMS